MIMKKLAAVFMVPLLMGAVFGKFISTAGSGSGMEASAAGLTKNEFDVCVSEMLELVNAERAKVGAASLELDDRLCQASAFRAMEISQSFDHYRPDGTPCNTVLSEFGIRVRAYGENIHYHSYGNINETAEIAVSSWMQSDGHRENLLNALYDKAGFGVYYSGGNYYWVQTFANNVRIDDSLLKVDMYGDVNNDGKVDSADASDVLAEYAAISTGLYSTMNMIQRKSSDVNSDGTIDSTDASVILTYYAHLSTGGKTSPNDFFTKIA